MSVDIEGLNALAMLFLWFIIVVLDGRQPIVNLSSIEARICG